MAPHHPGLVGSDRPLPLPPPPLSKALPALPSSSSSPGAAAEHAHGYHAAPISTAASGHPPGAWDEHLAGTPAALAAPMPAPGPFPAHAHTSVSGGIVTGSPPQHHQTPYSLVHALEGLFGGGGNGGGKTGSHSRRSTNPAGAAYPRRIDPKRHVEPLAVVGVPVGPHRDPVRPSWAATDPVAMPHVRSSSYSPSSPSSSPSPTGKHLPPLPTIAPQQLQPQLQPQIPQPQAQPQPMKQRPAPADATTTTLPPLNTDPMDLGGRALVFVLGGPGSGKGTQCVRLKEEFNLTHLSAGDLLRAEVATGSVLGAELNRIMAEGQLVPMSVTINLLRTSIQSSLDANPSTSGFLVDGFPRELDQATAFERATSLVPDFILFFDCPLATLEQRLLKRGETSGRADDNLAAIQKRFKTFTDQSVPVVDHYRGRGKVLEISSVLAVDTVYAVTRGKVLERVEGWRPKDGVDLKGRPLIFVLGGPGSGKGTQCAKIRELYTLAHLSVGDLLRDEVATGSDLGRRVNEYMKEGAIVPLEVTLSVVKRAVEAVDGTASGFLIDGFPREITQAVEWERKMCTPSLVLFYDCPLPLLESRLLKRGETSGRADDNLASIQKRFKTFHDTSMPVVDYYRALGKVATISSDASVESVLETTCRAIDSHRWETDHGQHALKRLVFENVVFVLGGPGSGKGTQCDRLVEHFKYVHLSTGDLLRAEVANGSPIGKQAEAIMKDGGMVPIDMIRTLLLMGMRASPGAPGYLVDGYPRTLEQAQDIVMILPPRCVLYYDCPAETLVGRLLKRGETSGRADDNAESIKKRIDTFHATTVPVVDFFDARGVVCKVDATRSVDDITADTMAAFKAWS